MEQCKHLAPAVTEKSPPAARLSELEWSLLRRFRGLKLQDQTMVFKLMEGLVRIAELER